MLLHFAFLEFKSRLLDAAKCLAPDNIVQELNDKAEELRFRATFKPCSWCTSFHPPQAIIEDERFDNQPLCPRCWADKDREHRSA